MSLLITSKTELNLIRIHQTGPCVCVCVHVRTWQLCLILAASPSLPSQTLFFQGGLEQYETSYLRFPAVNGLSPTVTHISCIPIASYSGVVCPRPGPRAFTSVRVSVSSVVPVATQQPLEIIPLSS